MLTATVQNFRGIRAAEITCAPLALIAGPNEQGKSSIIDALRALLDGNAKPYGLTKEGLADKLMHKGSQTGLVTIAAEGRAMTVNWPAGEVTTEGAPFRSTPHASGSVRFSQLAERERMTTLAQYLKTAPTKEELNAALAEATDLDEKAQAAIWDDTQKKGWDGAWQHHKTDGTRLKGVWEGITGANYGVKLAATWRPQRWTDDHEILTDAEIETELKTAQEALEAGIGKVAINDDERKRLEATTKNIPKLKELATTRAADHKRAQATLEKAEGAIKKIPVLPKDKWPACPHCAKPIQVMGDDVLRIPPKALEPAERQKIELDLEGAQRVFDEAMKARNEALTALQTAQGDLDKAQKAKDALEASDPAAISQKQIASLRGDVALWEQIKKAKEKIRNALAAHMAVIAKIDVVGILAPEGLRKKKLAAKLDAFNAKLSELCKIADWSTVEITPDGGVELGAYPYDLCARSGKMRCDVTIQVAFAQLDGSEVLLIDDADMMDSDGLNGLFTLLQSTGKYACVGAMLRKRKEAPDLERAQIGYTFWINDAESQPLSATKAA